MAQVSPVSSSRITGLLTRQRLTKQYQADQLDLFRLQEQISTGVRISLPSEDAPSALRAMSFQRLLSRKEQIASNVQNGLLFLGNTDATLGGADGVASVLSKIKADTLGVIGTVSTDEERQAAIANINGSLESLVALGNRQFNGRYIFSGSQTNVRPYSIDGGNVTYHGDDRHVENYSDIGVLYSSSISGQEVFGGISSAVEGTEDLQPAFTADTLLSSLRSGRGINPNGSLLLSVDSNKSSIVDITNATTVGDLVKLIEDNGPEDVDVQVTITQTGLQIDVPSGSLAIGEVGTGTTARELGLLTGNGSSTLVSEDLDPKLQANTRLENILGNKASAVLNSIGDSNNINIEALANGSSLNGVTISIVDGGDIGSSVGVVYDSPGGTLTISVDDDGETTANQVIDAINAEGSFRASVDHGDTGVPPEAGAGAVEFNATATIAGGEGESLDLSSGIRIVNGGETYEIVFDGDETVEDLLNRLNRSEAGVHAELNEAGTGINIRSRLSGNDFQIGENGGTTATQLGIRTYSNDSKLSEFNFGVGVIRKEPQALNISSETVTLTTSDGQEFSIDFSGLNDLNTLPNAINAINNAAGNDDGGGGNLVTAQLSAGGDGVVLVDNTAGTDRLAVRQSGDSIPVTGGFDLGVPVIDFHVTARDGTTLAIDISGAETVGDVISLINDHPVNDDGSPVLVARLAESGNGIEFEDLSGGTGDLIVTKIGTSQAAEHLGLIEEGQTSRNSLTDTFTGADRNSLETDSVFTSLIRLRDALADNDLPEIERAGAKLEGDLNRVTFAQADVGIRFQNLELTKFNLQDEEIQVRAALSEEIDVDLVEAISQMTARQTSLEASLRATANILQLSLLNFL